jgi:hypothetical protein
LISTFQGEVVVALPPESCEKQKKMTKSPFSAGVVPKETKPHCCTYDVNMIALLASISEARLALFTSYKMPLIGSAAVIENVTLVLVPGDVLT